ncbi:MAG: PD-(D/E)XK nuclease family protein, partial [Thiobacillaceae bacterium]
ELPWRAVYPQRQALLDTAWAEAAAPLSERARRLAADLTASPLLPDVRLMAAGDLESEARTAAEQVRAWAAEGITRIALIALDRLTARRLRALLERDGILIEDETGWTLSTAAVSHVIDRLLALRLDDCYHRDLIDLLKSPFVFADLDPDTRQRAVVEFETALRRAGVVAGLDRMQALARSEVPAALPLLDRLAGALARLAGSRRPLGDWQQRLLAALTDLGALPAFAADVAGRQLQQWLQRLTEAVAGHETTYGLAGWREWLALQLDQATFRDDRIDSPVRLVSLAGARLRDFDAAIVLSADAAHLPGSGSNGVFGDRVRAQLGLPTSAVRAEDLRGALSDVLCHIPRVLITWQARQEGEPNALSPWLELLDGAHRLAWGMTLKTEAPVYLDLAPAAALPATPAARPRPGRVPGRLSASAWQSLVDCPYRFYARHLLRLAEVEAVPEEMEKRDYGLLVHAILQRFHTQHPRLADTPRERLLEELQQITEAVFAPQRQLTYLALAWQLRWQRRMNDYLDWALAREAQGYRWQAGEVERERTLPLGGDGVVTLQGRLDRIDQGPQGLAVLDYKVKRRDTLRRRLQQPGEDVQLGFYGLLTDAAEAAYLILDDERVQSLGPDVDLPTVAAAERERLRATLAAMAAGAPLPAQGAPHTCAYCEMRGLCRRDYQPG